MTALSLMEEPSIWSTPGSRNCPADHASCDIPLLASTRYRGGGFRPPVAETGTVEDARLAAVNRESPRAQKNRGRLAAIDPADRMAEMRRVGIADILRQVRQID